MWPLLNDILEENVKDIEQMLKGSPVLSTFRFTKIQLGKSVSKILLKIKLLKHLPQIRHQKLLESRFMTKIFMTMTSLSILTYVTSVIVN